jgi:hypothetical protein
MLSPLDQKTESRQQIWSRFAEPLFDFVFDDETLDSDYRRIGRIAIDSEYTNDELAAIYWYEVFPAIAGSWISINPTDPTWLKQRICKRPYLGLLLTLLIRPWWLFVGRNCWRKIKTGIEIERGNVATEINSFVSIKDIGNDKY